MRHLITIFAVVSLVCLGAGGAYADATPPALDTIDWVNLGDAAGDNTEAGHTLVDWGVSISPSWWGPGGVFRQIWGPDSSPDDYNYATITLDGTRPPLTQNQLYFGAYFIAGAGEDNFYVDIDITGDDPDAGFIRIGEIEEFQGENTLVRKQLPIPDWVPDGIHNFKLECSEPGWAFPNQPEDSGRAAYGQVTVDEVYTFMGDEIIEPVLADGTTIGCLGGTKLVEFEFTKDNEDIIGYSVQVSFPDNTLSFDAGDVTVHPHATGLIFGEDYWYEVAHTIGGAPANDYTIDYAIFGDPVPADGIPSGNLFSILVHGVGDGTHPVGMDSAILRNLDNFDIAVDHATTVDVEVDCTAPTTPTLTGEGLFTMGLTNTVYWSGDSGVEYLAQCSLDAGFTDPVFQVMDWDLDIFVHTFTGLDHGETYYYRVMARDDFLNETIWSNVEFSTQDNFPPETEAAVDDSDDADPGDFWVDSFFDVTYTALDVPSGVASVELFYRIDGTGLDPFTNYGVVSSPLGFDASSLGEGTYEFYTLGTDNAGNPEVFDVVDATINVDMTAPDTEVDAFVGPITTPTFPVSYTLTPNGGSALAGVVLYFSFGNPTGPYSLYGTVFSGTSLTFDSSTTGGDGTYYFYSIGTDAVGNEELQPGTDYDVSVLVDSVGPEVTNFQINGGDDFTTSTSVTLSMVMNLPDVKDMRFSNDNANWSAWVEPPTLTHPWTLTSGDEIKTVYAQFRENVTLNFTSLQDNIELDTDPTGPVSGISADRGHNKITVSWTNPGEGELAVEVYRHMWYWDDPIDDPDMGNLSAYPEYDDLHDYVPIRLSTRQDVFDSPLWERALSGATTDILVDDPLERGIYYYEVFVQDPAGNWSSPANDYAYAISYLLGDVDPLDDGLVTGLDVSILGATYGIDHNHGSYNANCDIGPTDDYSGAGIPTTDNFINFEDLMIFALNWDEAVAKAPITEGGLIARFSWVEIDDTTWSLVLAEPCANLKGVNLKANLPQDGVLSITAGDLLRQQDYSYFLRNIARNGLDAGLALLGTDVCIAGQGELVRLELAEGIDLNDIEITARDAANKDLEFTLEEAVPDSDTPTRYMVSANYPNPFNPLTKIDFALPETQHVKLEIFGIDGRRVATLKNETMSAGNYTVTWMGRDHKGELVSSGMYFYRIQAGDFNQIQKMTLLK